MVIDNIEDVLDDDETVVIDELDEATNVKEYAILACIEIIIIFILIRYCIKNCCGITKCGKSKTSD